MPTLVAVLCSSCSGKCPKCSNSSGKTLAPECGGCYNDKSDNCIICNQ